MALVEFRPLGVSVEVAHGSSLLDAARRARVRLEAPCNGGGTCGKCRVRLDPASRARARIIGRHELSAADLESGWILLCSTLVEGDLTVDLPGGSERGLRILEDGRSAELPLAPWLTKRYDPVRGRTDLIHGDRLLGSEDGDTAARSWGVAVDIGTTTLVVSLIDLCTGSATGSASALNPQAVHAQDVLSRVHLGSTAQGLATLHGELMSEIDRLIGVLATEARVPRRRIYEVVVAGNTCMLHLAAGVNPEPLGRYPYSSTLSGDQYLPAAALGLAVSRHGQVYFPPIVSGFVGADISAGILSTGLAAAAGLTLFVDIGTNGEMVLARDGVLQATSTAAGPAFEGMNIACGMRAARGAIERFDIVDGAVHLQTIEDAPPVGLCGSGLLDTVAALVTHGVIEGSGRFTKNLTSLSPGLRERLRRRDDKPVFQLAEQVYLTQRDIRQVQLAKAAVRAGIDTLLKRNGLQAQAVERALIAGSFGYHLTTRSLIAIGLFPAAFDGKVEYVGNTARTGAETLLTNGAARGTLAAQVARVESVELANDPQFSDGFIAAMAFPAPHPDHAAAVLPTGRRPAVSAAPSCA